MEAHISPEVSPQPGSSLDLRHLRVAIVHHWFVEPWGGAERVVEAIARVFPQADLFAMMVDPKVLPPDLKRRKLTTSFLQRVPGKLRLRRHLLPLYPLALEQLDLSGYDLVVSSESAPAKGVLTDSGTCHICYCHSPMRYIWDMYQDYRRALPRFGRGVFTLASHYMRMWDVATAARVDYFVANSHNVASRVRKHYRREAAVIHPPVQVDQGMLPRAIGDYYLVLGRMVAYKRVDLAIQACNELGRKLLVAGNGADAAAWHKLAGPTVQFVGWLSDDAVRDAYAHCRALIFPGEEDFGLVPVEAQAFGRPVIAFGRGGALETVQGLYPGDPFTADASGVFFVEQSVASLVEAIRYFESVEHRFSPDAIRERARMFDEVHFRAAFESFVAEKVAECRIMNSRPGPRAGIAVAEPFVLSQSQ